MSPNWEETGPVVRFLLISIMMVHIAVEGCYVCAAPQYPTLWYLEVSLWELIRLRRDQEGRVPVLELCPYRMKKPHRALFPHRHRRPGKAL